ncbi:hypothetical protein F2P81_000679 [Scophthalmus maximus]|uniref:Uncharacterized protein n=1 Tax=Scophthalmus maximus TaxID=52904 RepID=A0A6A4THM5_SCOMX|nr:hypothetical protein F2P81_000679 [Scophthalmus maximus]
MSSSRAACRTAEEEVSPLSAHKQSALVVLPHSTCGSADHPSAQGELHGEMWSPLDSGGRGRRCGGPGRQSGDPARCCKMAPKEKARHEIR